MKIPVILLVLIIVGTLAELQEDHDDSEAADERMLADFYELAEEDRAILNEKRASTTGRK